jgi:hypothetical protein
MELLRADYQSDDESELTDAMPLSVPPQHRVSAAPVVSLVPQNRQAALVRHDQKHLMTNPTVRNTPTNVLICERSILVLLVNTTRDECLARKQY